MNLLDRIAAWLDRREVMELRQKVKEVEKKLTGLEDEIGLRDKTIRDQTAQIGSANQRVSYTTTANLELKRRLREEGVDADGLAA